MMCLLSCFMPLLLIFRMFMKLIKVPNTGFTILLHIFLIFWVYCLLRLVCVYVFMQYIQGINRNQAVLFSRCLDELVDQENDVRIIDLFVEYITLNFKLIIFGRTERHPQQLSVHNSCKPCHEPDFEH
jgi:hypothetical protein